MLQTYPYPFSRYVKSLPDPPPPKAREIKDITNRKPMNDYNWLIEAINNLKKCFHLCNNCSEKFNYMRNIVHNSNVPYKYNINKKNKKETIEKEFHLNKNRIKKDSLKSRTVSNEIDYCKTENGITCKEKNPTYYNNANTFSENKKFPEDNAFDKTCIKNILKITKKRFRTCSVPSSSDEILSSTEQMQRTPVQHVRDEHNIIFSNTLHPKKTENEHRNEHRNEQENEQENEQASKSGNPQEIEKENDTLFFNEDVYIYVSGPPSKTKCQKRLDINSAVGKKKWNNTEEDENLKKETGNEKHWYRFENTSSVKYSDMDGINNEKAILMFPEEVYDMVIHIKRYVKNNISYFGCEHLEFNALRKIKENSEERYDHIDVYDCDNDRIRLGSMRDCNTKEKKKSNFVEELEPGEDLQNIFQEDKNILFNTREKRNSSSDFMHDIGSWKKYVEFSKNMEPVKENVQDLDPFIEQHLDPTDVSTEEKKNWVRNSFKSNSNLENECNKIASTVFENFLAKRNNRNPTDLKEIEDSDVKDTHISKNRKEGRNLYSYSSRESCSLIPMHSCYVNYGQSVRTDKGDVPVKEKETGNCAIDDALKNKDNSSCDFNTNGKHYMDRNKHSHKCNDKNTFNTNNQNKNLTENKNGMKKQYKNTEGKKKNTESKTLMEELNEKMIMRQQKFLSKNGMVTDQNKNRFSLCNKIGSDKKITVDGSQGNKVEPNPKTTGASFMQKLNGLNKKEQQWNSMKKTTINNVNLDDLKKKLCANKSFRYTTPFHITHQLNSPAKQNGAFDKEEQGCLEEIHGKNRKKEGNSSGYKHSQISAVTKENKMDIFKEEKKDDIDGNIIYRSGSLKFRERYREKEQAIEDLNEENEMIICGEKIFRNRQNKYSSIKKGEENSNNHKQDRDEANAAQLDNVEIESVLMQRKSVSSKNNSSKEKTQNDNYAKKMESQDIKTECTFVYPHLMGKERTDSFLHDKNRTQNHKRRDAAVRNTEKKGKEEESVKVPNSCESWYYLPLSARKNKGIPTKKTLHENLKKNEKESEKTEYDSKKMVMDDKSETSPTICGSKELKQKMKAICIQSSNPNCRTRTCSKDNTIVCNNTACDNSLPSDINKHNTIMNTSRSDRFSYNFFKDHKYPTLCNYSLTQKYTNGLKNYENYCIQNPMKEINREECLETNGNDALYPHQKEEIQESVEKSQIKPHSVISPMCPSFFVPSIHRQDPLINAEMQISRKDVSNHKSDVNSTYKKGVIGEHRSESKENGRILVHRKDTEPQEMDVETKKGTEELCLDDPLHKKKKKSLYNLRMHKNAGGEDRWKCCQEKANQQKKFVGSLLDHKIKTILHMNAIPHTINVHNIIRTPGTPHEDFGNSNTMYFNDNYVFNLDRENIFGRCDFDTKNIDRYAENTSINYNVKQFDVSLCKKENDNYNVEYISNAFSSDNCNLSKKKGLRESFESEHFYTHIRNCANLKAKRTVPSCTQDDILYERHEKKKSDFLDDTNLNEIRSDTSPSAQAKLNDILKKTHSQGKKPFLIEKAGNETAKEPMEEDTVIKKQMNRVRKTVITTKEILDSERIYQMEKQKERDAEWKEVNNSMAKLNTDAIHQAPYSPKKQEKIPKPLSSQLRIGSISKVKKSPSYPFEELTF